MASFQSLQRCTQNCCICLFNVRLSRIIFALLLLLIIIAIFTHHHISKVTEDDTDEIHHSRYKFEALEDLGSPKAADLRFRIEEMMRIKLSVSNELRDLESKRQKLQGEISLHNQKIEELKADVLRQQQELEKLKLSVEQAKYAQQEAIEKNMPELAAPRRIFASEEDHVTLTNPSKTLSSSCRFHLCMDYSRCSFTSGFPVYFYNPEEHRVSQSIINTFILDSISRAINLNPHVTYDPHIACVFIVLIGESESQRNKTSVEKHLHELPYWYGDGRNHVLLNLAKNPTVKNILRDVNVGRALIAQSVYIASEFRPGFDIIVPPLLGKSHGPAWQNLPLYAPARRKFLLSFQGEHRLKNPKSLLNSTKRESVTSSSLHNITNYSEFDLVIVECLKKMQISNTDDNFFFQFVCSNGKIEGQETEWDVCENLGEREKILQESTFSLIIAPTNLSLVSTFLTQMRLYESLKNGAIPLILGDYVELPFADLVDWNKACLILPKARVTELHFLIRTIVDNDLYEMRHQGRLLWEKYFSTSENILNTILSFVRSRLKLPPLPIKEEPSPSVFNATFQPLKMEGIIADAEAEESVGPLESPYPSPRFRRNLTITINENYETWNTLMDPFRLYPFLPFDPILPSEAKFLGSGVGFRPIGKGIGGAGKEFSESLGGNVPREQFTVVMLTYEREAVLINSLQHLYGLPHLNKVVVVWNGPHLPPEDLRWPDIGVPVQVVKAKKNSLNNRFLPYDVIETEAILSVDDDAHLRHDEIMFGFRVWREARDRIVGFPGRYHAWDGKFKNWLYNSNYSCELSMVLTGAAFFHKYYAYMYSYIMPQAVRDKVDEYMNCEDIAMNFLVSHITRKPPLKVTSRWTFRCPGCPVALSEDNTHFQERHKCINFFVQVFGYMPLLNTQFRVDSVLFKTRLPHDKQKCFKFI